VSVNAQVNRKFYIDCLCNRTLPNHIVNSVTAQPLYLLFNPVYNLKNIYNNFQYIKVFDCPAMTKNLPERCCAAFADIVELYELESSMALKKDPKTIEKT